MTPDQMTELAARLREHAHLHRTYLPQDNEQKQWTADLDAAADLLDRLDKAERENERLNEIVEKKFLDSTVIRELSVRNGGLDMQVEGGPCMLFADAFADFLVESGAENYVEVSFTSEKRPEIGKIVVTVQRLSGKTPHALRREAELENERLKIELAAQMNGDR